MRCLCAFIVLLFPSLSHACDCSAPLPEYDFQILERADIIGHFEVVGVTNADWSKIDGAFITIKLQINDVYHGYENHFNTRKIIVKNDLSDGCSLHLKVGDIRDLILINTHVGLVVADMCTDLSQRGWDDLKIHNRVLSSDASYPDD